MSTSRNWFLVLLSVAALWILPGCSKKQATQGGESEVVQAAQKLPDGTNIIAAMDQKDYETAVSGLAKVQQAIAGGEGDQLQASYSIVKAYVRDKLMEGVAANDPKAADALNAVRMLTQGR